MADEQKPIVVRRGVGCFTVLVAMVLSAILGATLALIVLWYGPRNLGITFPDSTGRLTPLEQSQQTAVVERVELRNDVVALSDVSGTLDTLNGRVGALETGQNSVAELSQQLDLTQGEVDALQSRLNELESIPANAALAERIANAENELATVNATLERLRQAFSNPFAPPAATVVTATPLATPTVRLVPTPTP